MSKKWGISNFGYIEIFNAYPFDANFYAVQINDGLITHITNRRTLMNMVDSIPKLIEGTLDRDY